MPGKTVLVIDDDATFRQGVAGALREVGYNALEAEDGQQGIRAVEQLRTAIDLMIVDLALPALPGLEIIGAVTRRKTPIKIVATSGVFDSAYLAMVKDAGADQSVQKRSAPNPRDWVAIVRHLIGEAERPFALLSNRLALVVDDEPLVRGYVRSVLRRHGVQVLEAADGAEAIAVLRRMGSPVDVIVSDVKMPRMSGPEFVKVFRAESAPVPVVFMSGDDLRSDLHRPDERMFFVEKPFQPQLLLKAILDVLPRSAASGQ